MQPDRRDATTLAVRRDRVLIFAAGALSMLAMLAGAIAYGIAKADYR